MNKIFVFYVIASFLAIESCKAMDMDSSADLLDDIGSMQEYMDLDFSDGIKEQFGDFEIEFSDGHQSISSAEKALVRDLIACPDLLGIMVCYLPISVFLVVAQLCTSCRNACEKVLSSDLKHINSALEFAKHGCINLMSKFIKAGDESFIRDPVSLLKVDQIYHILLVAADTDHPEIFMRVLNDKFALKQINSELERGQSMHETWVSRNQYHHQDPQAPSGQTAEELIAFLADVDLPFLVHCIIKDNLVRPMKMVLNNPKLSGYIDMTTTSDSGDYALLVERVGDVNRCDDTQCKNIICCVCYTYPRKTPDAQRVLVKDVFTNGIIRKRVERLLTNASTTDDEQMIGLLNEHFRCCGNCVCLPTRWIRDCFCVTTCSVFNCLCFQIPPWS